MRTKTLLLTAALSAAGIATSMAQVYSVNAVGYVNTTLGANFNLISNPLIAADNTIGNLFASLPDGSQVFKFNGTSFTTATKDVTYQPAAAAALTVMPGEGVFVKLPPGTSSATVTFVGDVPLGAASNKQIPVGLSIQSSVVPQAGTATALKFPAVDGDQIFQYSNATQRYTTFTYDVGFSPEPNFKVGEAFFVRKRTAGTWTRDFSVTQ